MACSAHHWKGCKWKWWGEWGDPSVPKPSVLLSSPARRAYDSRKVESYTRDFIAKLTSSHSQACFKGPQKLLVPVTVAADVSITPGKRKKLCSLTITAGCPTPPSRDTQKNPMGQVTPNWIGENYIFFPLAQRQKQKLFLFHQGLQLNTPDSLTLKKKKKFFFFHFEADIF